MKTIRDSATMHMLWYSERGKANSEQGEVLENKNGAQIVASLDNFVSLRKSSVNKKEF